jgi:hypothetical protein
MTSFDERENAYEAEFAHREELEFKVREQAVKQPRQKRSPICEARFIRTSKPGSSPRSTRI